VVAPFLERHGAFECEEAPSWAGSFHDGPLVRIEAGEGGDAFFAARLRRRGGEAPEDVVT
jgi:16S rRNA C967 or C1407 C5-methylase (RsmB/RsmF family)